MARLGRRKSLADEPVRRVPRRHPAPGAQRDVQAVGRAGDAVVHPVAAHDSGPVADGELGAREADGDEHLLAPLGGTGAEEEVAAAAGAVDHVETRVVLATGDHAERQWTSGRPSERVQVLAHLALELARPEGGEAELILPPTDACDNVHLHTHK